MLSPTPATSPPATTSGDSEWLYQKLPTTWMSMTKDLLPSTNVFQLCSLCFPAIFIPLQSRLLSTWKETSQKEQKQCIKTIKVACEMVYDVIAPNAKDELLKSLGTVEQDAQSVSKQLDILMWTYMNAP